MLLATLDRGPLRAMVVAPLDVLAGLGSLEGLGEFVLEDVVESMSFFGMDRCCTGMGGLRADVCAGAAPPIGALGLDSDMSAALTAVVLDFESIISFSTVLTSV